MVEITLAIIVFIFLTLIALIDLITKKVPAFLTTALIFIVAMVNMAEIQFGMIHMTFGVLAFLFAYMLYEINFIGGIADVKVMIVIGMMVRTIPVFTFFMLLTMIFGVAYLLIWRFVLKEPEGLEVPFIISLWVVYIILWMSGGLI